MMRTVVHWRFFISFSRENYTRPNGVLGTAPDIAEVFGEKPTELGVIFLHDAQERYALE